MKNEGMIPLELFIKLPSFFIQLHMLRENLKFVMEYFLVMTVCHIFYVSHAGVVSKVLLLNILRNLYLCSRASRASCITCSRVCVCVCVYVCVCLLPSTVKASPD